MIKKELQGGKYVAVGLSESVFVEIQQAVNKATSEEEMLSLTLIDGVGITVKDVIQIATKDEWLSAVKWVELDETGAKVEKTYKDVLEQIEGIGCIHKYKNYNQFRGSNRQHDVGDINFLIGSNPKTPIRFKAYSDEEYARRQRAWFVSPEESFTSLWEKLYKSKYILISKS